MSDNSPRGIVDRVLTFIDRPWKAIVIIILIIVCGTGYLIYLSRAEIATAILQNKVKPKLDIETFLDEAPRVLRETGADIAVLTEFRLFDNIAISRAGVTRDGSDPHLLEGPHDALTETLDPHLLIRFLRNEVACFALVHVGNAEVQRRLKDGITYGCIVEVPPIVNVSVGGLFLGWKQKPDDETARRTEVIMTDAAFRFAIW